MSIHISPILDASGQVYATDPEQYATSFVPHIYLWMMRPTSRGPVHLGVNGIGRRMLGTNLEE